MYEVIVHILREISEQSSLARLLAPLPGQTESLHSLLLRLESQAAAVTHKIGHHQHPLTRSVLQCVVLENDLSGYFVRDFLQLSQQVTEALKTEGLLPIPVGVRETSSSGAELSGAGGGDEETEYRRALSVLQYDSTDFTGNSTLIIYSNFYILRPHRPRLPAQTERF